MFNLEKAIQSWKQSLKRSPAFEEGQIQEMETHLRDHIDHLIAGGMLEEEAFQQAVEKLGVPEELEDEVYKTKTTNKVDATPPWKQKSWVPVLLPNYIKTVLRGIVRDRGYAIIKIFGLAVAFACVFLISLFVLDEFSYDTHHQNADQIYRVVQELERAGTKTTSVYQSPLGLAQTLKEDFPEVTQTVNLNVYSTRNLTINYQQKSLQLETQLSSTPHFFDLFTMPLRYGDAETALELPNSIILTEPVAKALFDNQNPIGQVVKITTRQETEYTVTGVLEPLPGQTHLDFDVIISKSASTNNTSLSWGRFEGATYLEVTEGASVADLEAKLDDLVERTGGGENKLYLQNILDVHLYSDFEENIGIKGDIRYIYIFSITAFLVLLVAGINFTNLSIAQTQKRGKEVGIRKILGAHRFQIIKQLLGESVIFSLLAFPVSIFLMGLALPYFNILVDKSLTLFAGNTVSLWGIIIAIILLTGFLAGSYGAIFLSRFSPNRALKGTPKTSVLHLFVNKGLLVIQFTIAIALIAVAIIMNRQLDYATGKALGYDKEHVLVIPANSFDKEQLDLFKQKALTHSNIIAATATNWIPGENRKAQGFLGENETQSGEAVAFIRASIHPDFFTTLKMPVKYGRYFKNDDLELELQQKFGSVQAIANETLVQKLGMEIDEVLGQQVNIPGLGTPKIIGILEDFHITSFHHEIVPMAFKLDADPFMPNLLVRINSDHYQAGLNHLEAVWKNIEPDVVFDFFFLDDYIQQLYTAEQNLAKLFNVLTFIAIFVAVLGLIGLVAFAAERRTKEIGIRKVLGASLFDLINLLSKEYALLLLISFIIATPAAFIAGNLWLQDFVYKINPEASDFIFAGAGTFIVTLAIVAYRAFKSSKINPVKSLRSE